MKVLHVEAGRHLYGGALQVVFLLQGLRARYPDDEHVLVCPPGAEVVEAARPYAARIHELPMGGDLDPGMLRRLRQLIRRERPDLVHLHSRRGSDLWGGVAARLEGVPAVLSRRVDNPEPRWWARLKYRLYAHVVTISEGIRRVLLEEGVTAAKVTCVHSAVDTVRYRPGCEDSNWFRREFGLEEGQPAIGMAAQFIPRKGHAVAVEALARVLEEQPRARLLLFGRGPLRPEIERQVLGLGLHGKVAFAGFRDDLHRILPCLDLLVHPASMEGLGVTLLQAAACGLPIVAGRAGGIPEVVRHQENGLLVEPGDVAAVAEALLALLRDPEMRRSYGTSGRRLVEKEFSCRSMVSGNAAVYRTLVAQRRRPG